MARIDPNKVVEWLVTQTNSRGNLHSETLARQYMEAVVQAPGRLGLPDDLANISAFSKGNSADLERLWKIWETAPNYTERNRQTGNALSAGMGCLLEYLCYRESQSLRVRRAPRTEGNASATPRPSHSPTPSAQSTGTDVLAQPMRLLRQLSLEYIDHRSAGGALWVVGGEELRLQMALLRRAGYPFTFKAGGGRASGWRDAWWHREQCRITSVNAKNETETKRELDSDTVAAWLLTQTDADGKRYQAADAQHYMEALRTTPAKLDLPPAVIQKSVFSCRTPEELKLHWELLKTAFNYQQLRAYTSIFDIGVQCLLRYLESHPANAEQMTAAPSANIAEPDPKRIPNAEAKNGSDIDPDAVVAWLITQPNANGTLYLEYVVRQYMQALRSMPAKLDLPASITQKSVFSCRTPEELDLHWATLQTAPNFYEIANFKKRFQPGVQCFRRYLEAHPVNSDQLTSPSPTLQEIPATPQPAMTTAEPASPASPQTTAPQVPAQLIEILSGVLQRHFSNGFPLNDGIELLRFREFTRQDVGKPIRNSVDDAKLTYCIRACGPVFQNRVYPVPPEAMERLYSLVASCLDEGAAIIFFDQFYQKYEDWLFDACIVSSDMLRFLLQKRFPRLTFTDSYCGQSISTIPQTVAQEVQRVWGDVAVRTYAELAELLPYIPFQRIKTTLVQNPVFTLNAPEAYANLDLVEIKDEEREKFVRIMTGSCEQEGYASLSDLDLDDLQERNYELSENALAAAVFQLCLSDRFERNRNIITPKGASQDIRAILERHLSQLERCGLDELTGFAETINGSAPALQTILEAAHSVMVRIDKDTFLSDALLHFDVEGTDETIARALEGTDGEAKAFVPLQAFTTFAAFPDCGQVWNLFVLESYCRRFSKRFRFDAHTANSANCGAIIRKENSLIYNSLLVEAALQAGLPARENEVGEFLITQGYLARKTLKIKEIVSALRTLKTRRA